MARRFDIGAGALNLVDNLILSCLGYVVLDTLVSGFECDHIVTVKETADLFAQLPEAVKNLRVPEDETLLAAMGKSRRFGGLQLLYHVQQLDRAAEKTVCSHHGQFRQWQSLCGLSRH